MPPYIQATFSPKRIKLFDEKEKDSSKKRNSFQKNFHKEKKFLPKEFSFLEEYSQKEREICPIWAQKGPNRAKIGTIRPEKGLIGAYKAYIGATGPYA